MEDPGGFYVIGLGDREDPNTGRGPLYLEMLAGREIALPVFFSTETLERYARGITDVPPPETQTAAELEAGRYRVVRLKGEGELLELAEWAGADCLVWDPYPGGETHQVYRIPE
jgi:hypothetical protein